MNPEAERILELSRELASQHLTTSWFVDMNNDPKIFGEKNKDIKQGTIVFGVCMSYCEQISLNLDMVKKYPFWALWKQIMLHEIAHAKAGYKASHGLKWKIWCWWLGTTASPTLEDYPEKILMRQLDLEVYLKTPPEEDPLKVLVKTEFTEPVVLTTHEDYHVPFELFFDPDDFRKKSSSRNPYLLPNSGI